MIFIIIMSYSSRQVNADLGTGTKRQRLPPLEPECKEPSAETVHRLNPHFSEPIARGHLIPRPTHLRSLRTEKPGLPYSLPSTITFARTTS